MSHFKDLGSNFINSNLSPQLKYKAEYQQMQGILEKGEFLSTCETTRLQLYYLGWYSPHEVRLW